MYQVLARKWRPKKFSEMVGQTHILRMLENAIKQQRLHHAYLFSGTRGVGKTTLGRILAKCLNCETGITAEPCCKCDNCLAIDAGKFIDLIEVDAASKTKVEDTRALLENVQYTPALGRFKIYLIDEVHMLSGHSFNALLKTLEEPPKHVKFFLATTDPDRLPVTVLSRCLQFNLTCVAPKTIADYLKHLLQEEKIAFEDEALWQIALAAKGSVRDSLSLLDQAISYSAGNVNAKDINAMLGVLDRKQILELVSALSIKDSNKLFSLCQNMAELNVDFAYVLDELIMLLSNLALQKAVPNAENFALEWASTFSEAIKALANKFSAEDLQLYYQIAILAKRDLPFTPTARLALEMALLRMLDFTLQDNPTAPSKPTTNVTKTITPPTIQTNAPPQTIPTTNQAWQELLATLAITGPTQAMLQHCTVKEFTNQRLTLLLTPNQAPLLNKKHEQRLKEALQKLLSTPISVAIVIGTSATETPAAKTSRLNESKLTAATQNLNQDDNVKALIDTFGATLITESIKGQE